MLLQLFFSMPMLAFVWLTALIIALTVHEFAHAIVGKWRGDDTAEKFGRLSLSPLSHIDPLGFLMLVTIGFGWAKPVPFDPRNLKSPLKDGLLIALAGPISNLIMATVAAALFRIFLETGVVRMDTMLGAFLVLSVLVNLLLLVFNLIPVHPLDGSKLVDVVTYRTGYEWIARWLQVNGPRIMLVLVLIALMTSYDPFYFIQLASYAGCDQLIGSSCGGLLGMYFGG
ncbi:MAG: site-2 protease family protein [Patescibacteria group bacterium]